MRILKNLIALVIITGSLALSSLAQAATLEVGVADHFDAAVREAAAAFVTQTGIEVKMHTVTVPAGVFRAAREGKMDVLIPQCDRAATALTGQGLLKPETTRTIFWRHVAIVLPPQNPRGVTTLKDILRPGVRVGSLLHMRPRMEKIVPALCADPSQSDDYMAIWARDPATLLDLLAEGKIDAALCWNNFGTEDPRNFVVINLPSSQAGPMSMSAVQAFVTSSSKQPELAQRFVDFLNKDLAAQDTFLRNGLMTDNGADATDYDKTAAPRFAKVYENICRQLIDDYKITTGNAIDIGCGTGQMTIKLAQMTKLNVTGVDIEPEAIVISGSHAQEAGLADRCHFVCADAHSLPFPDNYADLIVSRGTLPFLRDQALAIREVYRVLKPGGVAFLGGGMGRYTKSEEAKKLYPQGLSANTALDWAPGQTRADSIFPFPIHNIDALMTRAGISNYRVINEGGRWIEMRK